MIHGRRNEDSNGTSPVPAPRKPGPSPMNAEVKDP